MTVARQQPHAVLIVSSHDRAGSNPSGYWFEELAAPYYVFRDAGWRVTIVSIRRGVAPLDPASTAEQWMTDDTRRFAADPAAQAAIAATPAVAELNPAEVDAVFLVGGLATMWDFPGHQPLRRLIEALDRRHGLVASVCHGASGLLDAMRPDGTPLVQGRRIVCWTDEEERQLKLETVVPFLLETSLRSLGAAFAGGPAFQACVQQDGNLVTGQNPASSKAAAQAVVKALSAAAAA